MSITKIEWADHQKRYGQDNHMWKGGRSIASNGYIIIRVGKQHHLSDVRGYAYEHRLVAESIIGRPLKKGEVVHHKDGNKQNNNPSNIEVTASIAHHFIKHRKTLGLQLPEEPNPVIECACGCGVEFQKYDNEGRPRQYVSGHNIHPKERS